MPAAEVHETQRSFEHVLGAASAAISKHRAVQLEFQDSEDVTGLPVAQATQVEIDFGGHWGQCEVSQGLRM